MEQASYKVKGGGSMVAFDDFAKLDLRVAKIVEVADHPNADKLYVVKADIGGKEIQLVAGIKQYYSPQELQGKRLDSE